MTIVSNRSMTCLIDGLWLGSVTVHLVMRGIKRGHFDLTDLTRASMLPVGISR